jgi:hypothetical protein
MAYVVGRGARFEIRESLHTPAGPRARSLANFSRLSDEVLATAERRACRPFDRAKVLASAARAGAPVEVRDYSGFVDASRRFGRRTDGPPDRPGRDPGVALIELLGFADRVSRSVPRRGAEELMFPVLARLVARRH